MDQQGLAIWRYFLDFFTPYTQSYLLTHRNCKIEGFLIVLIFLASVIG